MSADRLSIDSPRPKALERRGAQMAARERQSATDYAKWDLFTPSDDEDDPWCVHPARAQRRASDAVCHCELMFS